MKRRKSLGFVTAEAGLWVIVIAFFVGCLLLVWNMPEARKRKNERVEQGVAACDALHESILLASSYEMGDFLLNSAFLHVVSKSEQPLSI